MFGRCVMKKLLLIILMMLLLPIVHVSAADTVSFSADNIECKNNRLIEVNLYAKCDKKLSAATFEFGFDKTILEFRGVGKPKGTLVEYNEKSNSVKLSYLCKDGADISSKAAVFTLKFKTISEGFSDITYSVFDCADSDIGQMTIGNCTSGKVTVTSKAPDNIGTEDKSGSFIVCKALQKHQKLLKVFKNFKIGKNKLIVRRRQNDALRIRIKRFGHLRQRHSARF